MAGLTGQGLKSNPASTSLVNPMASLSLQMSFEEVHQRYPVNFPNIKQQRSDP
jgi:hypothetical protein